MRLWALVGVSRWRFFLKIFKIQIHKNQFIMKLISEIKAKEHKSKYNNGTGLCATHETFFNLGVEFAENELQILAAEFAEWIGSENCDYIPSGVLNEWINSAVKGMQIYITSKELFELFLKTRIA